MCVCRRIWSFSSSPVSMIGMRQRLQRARSFYYGSGSSRASEGQFYIRDLIGMEVEEQGGSFHGVVTDVLQNTAQDIFEVKRDDGKTVLIPKVDAFVQKIDGKERLITVTLIEGLTDL